MTEQQQKIQNLLDEFIGRNVSEIERVSKENPLLLKSVLDVVSIISKKYGEGKAAEVKIEEPVEEKSEEVKPTKADFEFKEGDKFYKPNMPYEANKLYEIVGIRENDVVVIKKPDGDIDLFTSRAIKRYFKEGIWILVDQKAEKPEEKRVETVTEIKQEQQEQAEQLSAEDIKAAIKNLKPLAQFDEDVQKEIERLKKQLKSLKSKKS